jgi:hypothetical protein
MVLKKKKRERAKIKWGCTCFEPPFSLGLGEERVVERGACREREEVERVLQGRANSLLQSRGYHLHHYQFAVDVWAKECLDCELPFGEA